MANLVAVQMVSTPEPEQNFARLNKLLQQLPEHGPTLVVLPECFSCFGGSDKLNLALAEAKGDGPIQSRLSELARQHGVWLCAGTIPIATDHPNKFTASSLLFDAQGESVSEYQKIHLFDVQVQDSTGHYQESATTQAGHKVVVARDTPFGHIGLSVCYDLRFPGLFQAMGEVDVITIPSAFTDKTGRAHWAPLLTARAIEKQCYVVAANQGGLHANGRETYGHSCIISPWGTTLDRVAKGEGIAQAKLEAESMQGIRKAMPVAKHNRFRSHFDQSR